MNEYEFRSPEKCSNPKRKKYKRAQYEIHKELLPDKDNLTSGRHHRQVPLDSIATELGVQSNFNCSIVAKE